MLPFTTHLSGLGAANTGLTNAALILGPLFAATPYNGILHVLQILSFDDLDFGQPRVSQACKWQNHPSVVGRLHFFPFGPGRLYLHGCGFKCWLTCCTIIGFASCAKPVVTVVVGSSSSTVLPPRSALSAGLQQHRLQHVAIAPHTTTSPAAAPPIISAMRLSSEASLKLKPSSSCVSVPLPGLAADVRTPSHA